LLCGTASENIDAMKAALEAGANVNGSPDQPLVPIVVAAIAGHAGTDTFNFLLEQGADPDMPLTKDMLRPGSRKALAFRGERALHIAARKGNADIVRLLLNEVVPQPQSHRQQRAHPTQDNLRKLAQLCGSGAAAARGGRRSGRDTTRIYPSPRVGRKRAHGLG
ncbi:unnamed protein product, partial [Laminaria digitata]